jgi:hypothetical protein
MSLQSSPPLTSSLQSPLHNHLRDPLPAQRLAPHEALSLQTSKRVERSREEQEHRRGNQARSFLDDAQPLYQTHCSVYSCAHVVCGETAYEGIEGGGRGTDAEEEGDFNEDEDEAGYTMMS